jgi:hypothetical protein
MLVRDATRAMAVVFLIAQRWQEDVTHQFDRWEHCGKTRKLPVDGCGVESGERRGESRAIERRREPNGRHGWCGTGSGHGWDQLRQLTIREVSDAANAVAG